MLPFSEALKESFKSGTISTRPDNITILIPLKAELKSYIRAYRYPYLNISEFFPISLLYELR